MNHLLSLSAIVIAAVITGCAAERNGTAAGFGPGAEGIARLGGDLIDVPETNLFEIETPHGTMLIRLYDETPVHRDNFRKLAAEGFYDETLFHRVIEGFMIQGGDPTSRDGDPEAVGQGGPGYTLPSEIQSTLIHRRGAVAAARQGDAVNPERRSSGSQFYVVHGRIFDDEMLDMQELRVRQGTGNMNFRFSESAREIYATRGGAPHLDLQYTIFGELVDGFDVLDRIARAATPNKLGEQAPPHLADRPQEDIWMRIRPVYPEEERPDPEDSATGDRP